MQFNFLGKDSIKYENTVEVELPVYNAILKFQKGGKLAIDFFIYFARGPILFETFEVSICSKTTRIFGAYCISSRYGSVKLQNSCYA